IALSIRHCEYTDYGVCVVRGRTLCRNPIEWLLPRDERLRVGALDFAERPAPGDGCLFETDGLVHHPADCCHRLRGAVSCTDLFHRLYRARLGCVDKCHRLGRHVVARTTENRKLVMA